MGDRYNGNLFVDRLRIITGAPSDEAMAPILDKILTCNKSKVSRWRTGKRGPSADELVLIDEKYHCGIDYLLGRSEKTQEKKSLTFRDVARMLVEIDEGFKFLTTVKEYVSHEIPDPDTCFHTKREDPSVTIKYPTVFLHFNPIIHEYMFYSKEFVYQTGSVETVPIASEGFTSGYIELNKFLNKYLSWRENLKADVDQEEWDALLNKALEKVPEDEAPFPLEKWICDSESWIPEDLQEREGASPSEEAASEPTPEPDPAPEKKSTPKRSKKES